MPLNTPILKEDIKKTLKGLYESPGLNQEQARERFATELSNHIEKYVKSGLVKTVVTVTSTTSGTGIGTIE